MIEINKTTAFSEAEDNQTRSGNKITEAELEALIASVSQLMDESVRENFSERMLSHVGNSSTYTLKDTVLQSLKIIYDKLENPNTTESEKKIIAFKLQERAEECTPGFHNGVNAVVDSFYAARDINDLLFRVRQDIVTRVASQLSDDVHVNNRCFVLAENLGYGVQALNRDDHYLEHLTDIVPNEQIEQALSAAFEKEFRVFSMLQGLEDQLRGQLDSAGYVGPKDTPYASDEQAKIEASLKQLFKDNAVVVELRAAEDTLNEQDNLKKALSDDVEVALENMGLSKRSVQVFLNPSNKPPILQEQLQKKLDSFSDADKEALEKIKSNYMREIAAFDTSARDRLTAANQAFETKFFVVKKDEDGMNEGITDINWPNIREMLWEEIKNQAYFEFTNGEDAQFDILMNPQASNEASINWPLIINSVDELGQAVQYIAPEKIIALIDGVQGSPRPIMKNGHDLGDALKPLHESQIKAVIDAMQGKLLDIIKSGYDLGYVLKPLNEAQRTVVIEAIKDDLRNIIERGTELGYVLKPLNETHRTAVIDAIEKEELQNIIKSGHELGDVLEPLNERQRTAMFGIMKDKLQNIIKSGNEFKRVFELLNEAQRAAMFEVMKDKLLDIIEDVDDFEDVLEFLNEAQIEVVFEVMKDKLPDIVDDVDGQIDIVEPPKEAQRTVEIDAMQDPLQPIMKSGHDLGDALKPLHESQIKAVIDAMQGKLLDIIKSGYDLGYVLQPLNEAQRTVVIEAIKDDLRNIIEHGTELGYVLKPLNEAHRTAVIDAIEKEELQKIIKSGHALGDVLEPLNEPQRTAMFGIMKDKLQNIIKNGNEFKRVFELLNEAQRAATFELMKDKLPDIIEDVDDFEDVLEFLNEAQSEAVFEVMKDKLPDIIKKDDDDCFEALSKHGKLSEDILSKACEDGDIDIMKALIHKGVNFSDLTLGRTVDRGNLDVINTLIDYGSVSVDKVLVTAVYGANQRIAGYMADRLIPKIMDDLNLEGELEKLGLEKDIIARGLEDIQKRTHLSIPQEVFGLHAQAQLKDLVLNQLKKHVYDTTSTLGSKIQHHKNPILDKLFGITPKKFLDFKKSFQALTTREETPEISEEHQNKSGPTP